MEAQEQDGIPAATSLVSRGAESVQVLEDVEDTYFTTKTRSPYRMEKSADSAS
jgi:hypothetical protein